MMQLKAGIRRSSTACAAIAVLAMAVSPSAAQQRSNAPKPEVAAVKPMPANAPARPDPGLIYSPWTKICTEKGESNESSQGLRTQRAKLPERKRVCFTTKEARLDSGVPAAAVALVEPDKEAKKLRVSLPLGMQLPPGTRIVVDQGRPVSSPYLICMSDGCVAEYDATPELISRLKKGKQLAIQAVNADAQAIAINLPLNDFAKVVDGRPTDMSAFEAEQRKRDEDLERRINEARDFVARAREFQTQSPSGR